MERKYAIRIYFLIWTGTPLVHYALSGGFSMFPPLICEIRCPDLHLSNPDHEGKIWTKSVLSYIILEGCCHRREMRGFINILSSIRREVPRVRCGRCGREAKALYVREWSLKFSISSNDDSNRNSNGNMKYKARWVRVGYRCEKCGCVVLNGEEYYKKSEVQNLLRMLTHS